MINHQNFFATNPTSNILAGATTSPLNSIPTIDAPFYLTFGANGTGTPEVAYITSKTATNVNHAALAYAHTTAEEVRCTTNAGEMDKVYQSPRGHLLNGKIVVTDAAGITVAIKTLAGADPTPTDPVVCRIGDTVREITSALSVAKADGTNWCNAGSTELATKEIDYFVYLGYNATDGVVLGFSRIPFACSYDDFSATTTNEKYCAISTITNASATDYYEVIGRFAATLSAGAGYTWSVPTYTAKNLIQRPIFETRALNWAPVYTGFSSKPTVVPLYIIQGKNITIICQTMSGTSNATGFTFTVPFTFVNAQTVVARVKDSAASDSIGIAILAGITFTVYKDATGGLWTNSGTKNMQSWFAINQI